MKTKHFQALVRHQIRLILESDGYPIVTGRNPTHTATPGQSPIAGQSDLSDFPGAPFGGRLYPTQIAVMPNEARDILRKWAKVCQWASKKHGKSNSWPALVTQTAIELGRQFEERVGQTVPGTDTAANAGNLAY